MKCPKIDCCNNDKGYCKALIDNELYIQQCAFYKTQEQVDQLRKQMEKRKIMKDKPKPRKEDNTWLEIKIQLLGGQINNGKY